MKTRNLALLALGTAGLLAGWRARRKPYSFLGKVALITGGSRGLGLEIARRLAREGASLVLVARKCEELDRAAKELERLGARVLTIPADLSSPEGPADAVLKARNYFGRIDILVNNAGVMQVGPIDTMTEQDFKQAMEVHYWAPLKLALACIPFMRRREGKPFLTFTLPARAGRVLSTLAPNLFARALGLVNRMLPSSNGNTRSTRGRDIPDRFISRWQRRINESAALRNNELPYRRAG